MARPAGHVVVEAALAFAFGGCWFVLSALLLDAIPSSAPIAATLIGVASGVAGVLVFARYGGIGDAVSVGVAAVVALDWYTIPPVHGGLVPDAENAVALGAYLVTGTLLGQLAAVRGRRAEASERAASALAAEQAALRRVATLVAREATPEDVFALVTAEVAALLSIDVAALLRYESDGRATVLATWTRSGLSIPVALRMDVSGDSVSSAVLRTGRPARLDSYEGAAGMLASTLREFGVRSSVGSPIVVEGRIWGVMIGASTSSEPVPDDTEFRLGEFTELAEAAVANAEARKELTMSRARVVAAGDQARQRIERDLHDGLQQRLLSLALDLSRVARIAVAGADDLPDQVGAIRDGLVATLDDLRELSRGIHPAILSEGGLQPALGTLARRSPLPVHLEVRLGRRLSEALEVCLYYVASEALTNAIKHSRATCVWLTLEADDASARLEIRDDGIGGVDLRRGSGLLGLTDRVHAAGGTIEVSSTAGTGTTLRVRVPASAADATAGAGLASS